MHNSCPYFNAKQCISCSWLERPYHEQITQKEQHLKTLLAQKADHRTQFLPSVTSPIFHFRNKAKMVVTGAVERPILGIADEQGLGQSLTGCPLYPESFQAIFPILKDFIGRAGLVPYNIAKRKGELKYILLTESQATGELMLRFVLRSENKLPLIQRELPQLQAKLPKLTVITTNIQPQHAAILEGEKEIFLTEQQYLAENFNDIPLFIRPQGFFQTNPNVAAKLYATAQQWLLEMAEIQPISQLWDLFCGVGGFGLHCANALKNQPQGIQLTGIEIASAAIYAAQRSAVLLGLTELPNKVQFQSLDAAEFALAQKQLPDAIIVNPPRRGIGKTLAQFLEKSAPHFILYSSCNSQTFAKDLQELPSYRLEKVQLFDMFPHTSHYEVLGLLIRH